MKPFLRLKMAAFPKVAAIVLLPFVAAGAQALRGSDSLARADVPVRPLASRFVAANGRRFSVGGRTIVFFGSSFYPSPVGGASAWHRQSFPTYIDDILAMQAAAGLNIIRPTDYWSSSATGQTMTDSVLWANMDYLVHAAKTRGIWVEMDLSAWKKLLESEHRDPYDAKNWETFLDWVGSRYRDEPNIAFWYLSGEPPVPKTAAACTAMVSFFRAITDRMRAVDPNHLISAGGFNHMNDERTCDWWHQIYRLPNNQVLGYKSYSEHDLELTPTITAFADSLGKPLINAEFGEPQSVGDCDWSGVSYNGLRLSRSAFFRQVVDAGRRGGAVGFMFWNLGPEVGPKSYEVSPAQPCLWHELRRETRTAARAVYARPIR